MIEDPIVKLTTRVWDWSKTYSIEEDKDTTPLFLTQLNIVGHETIAGLHCDDYQFPSYSGKIVEICITRDGVHLKRAENGLTTTAMSVEYGPVPAESSVVPYGYLRVPADNDRIKQNPPPPAD